MINIMIVDDELTIREGIKSTFQWEKYGLLVCGTAASGTDALYLIDETAPDIIILDIKMSDMSGLEVLEIVRNKYPNIKVILISGHDDFEYAQKAIELNAFCYVLKPIDEKKLLEKILAAKKVIEEQFLKIKSDESLNKRLKEGLPALRNVFLHQLLKGKLADMKTIKEKSDFLEINLNMPEHAAVIFDLQNEGSHANRNEYEKSLMKLAVINAAENIFGKVFHYNCFDCEESMGIIIQGFKIKRSALKNTCWCFKEYVNNTLGLIMTLGIGGIHEGIQNIPLSYKEAVDALEYKLILGRNEIIDIEKIEEYFKKDYAESSLEETIKENEASLINALKVFNKVKIASIIDDVISSLREAIKINVKKTDRLTFLLSFFLTKILLALDIGIEKFFDLGNDTYNDMKKLETIEEFKEYINCFLSNVMSELMQREISNNGFLVNKAMEYIHENVYSDISLTGTANSIYINPNYLSKIFKQEINESFIEYVTKIKMNEAKKLLKSSNLKVYEIADMLRYKDVNHFTKIFKRYMSVTPSEYRELSP